MKHLKEVINPDILDTRPIYPEPCPACKGKLRKAVQPNPAVPQGFHFGWMCKDCGRFFQEFEEDNKEDCDGSYKSKV